MEPATGLKMAMRQLWEEHITFTRNYIISALADLPDGDAVAKRLLKNQGWQVIVIWQCRIRNKNLFEKSMKTLVKRITQTIP